MTEESLFDSAQGALQLSQDIVRVIMNEFNATHNGTMPAVSLNNPSNQYLGALPSGIQVPQLPYHSETSMPAMTSWPGDYSFKVSFDCQDFKNKQASKNITWTYSEPSNKLYVRKDAPCPINFSTSVPMGKDVFIRAMAVFSSPQHSKEIVTRCINHSMQEYALNVFEAEHLIRCESASRVYHVDARSQRHSVCVPFENPPVGQSFSSYLYKFVCFGSCSGGPNRRPITLIFTLEQGNQVLGRRCMDLKVCACPLRDRDGDEKKLHEKATGVQAPVSLEDTLQSPPLKKAMLSCNNSRMSEMHKRPHSKKEPKKDLYVKADDEAMYKYLVQMKTLFRMHKKLPGIANSSMLFLVRSSSDEVRTSSDEDKMS